MRPPPESPGVLLTQRVGQAYAITTTSLPPCCRLLGSEVMMWTKCLPRPSHLDDTPGLSQEEPRQPQKTWSLTASSGIP